MTHALTSEGHDASEDGTGRGTPIIPILEVSGGTTSRGDGPNGCGIGEAGDPMFTLQRGKQHAIAFDTTQCTSHLNRSNPKEGDPCHPLASGAHAPAVAFGIIDGSGELESVPTIRQPSVSGGGHPAAVAFTERTRADGRNFEAQEEVSYALTNPGSGGRTHSRQIATQSAVRRLTPRECERLQGFPDDYTAGFSDSVRYRMLGNAVAVPVAAWIAKRLKDQL